MCFLLAAVMVLSLLPSTMFAASAVSNMTISEQGLETLKSFEGFSATAYYDYSQWSIGYGTACGQYEYPNGITEEKAEELLLARLAISAKELNEFADQYGLNFTQGQFDALMLFTYNCGEGWMGTDGRFRQSVINGDTGNEFVYNLCLWSIAGTEPSPGLLNRRLCEADMYLNGNYSISAPANYNYVILNAQGGTLADRMQGYISDSTVMIKPVPVRTGYRFLGWYTQAEGGAWVTGLNANHDGMTLHAHWQSGEGSLDAQGNVQGTAVDYTVSAGACVNLNQYAKPNEAAEIKGTMSASDTVTVVADYVDDCGIKWGKLSSGLWVMLGSPVPSQTVTSQPSVTVTVTNEFINVRRNPGAGSQFLGTVKRGEKLTIVRTQTVNKELWGKFSEGWVSLKYTDYDIVMDDLNNEGKEVIATGVVKVNDYLRVRQGPGTNYAEVGKLLAGDVVRITQIRRVGLADWGRIEQGWICMDYVVLTEDEESTEPTDPSDSTDPTDPEDDSTAPTDPEDDTTNPDEPDDSETAEEVLFTGKVVRTNTLRVRSGPGTKNQQVGVLTGGQKVNILEKTEVDDAPWGRISTGWICLLYVQPDPTEEDIANAKYGVVTSFSNLNIRSEPGAHNALMGTLTPGTIVAVYEQTLFNNVAWGRIDQGWVSMQYVTLDETIDPSLPPLPENPDQPENPSEPDEPSTEVMYTGSVRGTYALRVRTGPGTNYAEITRLTYGVKVNIYEIRKVNNLRWGRIDNGWVCLTYIELVAHPDNVTQPLNGTVETNIPLKIRTGPGVHNDQVGMLTRYDKVTIYEITFVGTVAWGRMDKGWVCMDYVILDVPDTAGTPSTPTDPTEPTDPEETTEPTDPDETTEPTDPSETEETTPPTANVHYTGRVIRTNSLRIRKEAGTNHPEVGRLTLGAKVEILEITVINQVKWGRIDKGWICLDYVELDATAENVKYSLPGKVTVGNIKLKIRTGAGVQNQIVGELANDTKITIYEIVFVGTVAWGRMDQGWVCMDYVILEAPDPSKLPDVPVDPDETEPDETEPDETDPDETDPTETEPEEDPVGPNDPVLYTGKVYNTTSLKIYKHASKESALIGTLGWEAPIKLYRVSKLDGIIWGRTEKGWIDLANMQVDPTLENVKNSLSGIVVSGNTPLRIRAGAGVSYTQVGSYNNGTKIAVYNITFVNKIAWGRVDKGWVCLDYVVLQVPDPAIFEDTPDLPVSPDQPKDEVGKEDTVPTIPDVDLTDPETPKEDVEHLVIDVTAETIGQLSEYPNLKSVNFRNSTCYEAILAYKAANPEIDVTYKVSLGETEVLNDAIELTLISGKFDMEKLEQNLEYLPDVKLIHLKKTTLTPEQIKEFADAHEDITVTYSVVIGNNEIGSERESAELQPGALNYELLCQKLPSLPKLTKLKLRSTNLTAEELADLAGTFPGIEISYTVYMFGQEVASDSAEINLSNIVTSQIETAAAKFSLLPNLTEVQLVDANGKSNLKVADVKKLMTLAPDMKYGYSFDFFGTTVDIHDERVEVAGRYIGDDNMDYVRDVLSILQNCSYFLLDDCGISNENMAQLREDYRGTTKIVWRVYFASHKDQPNYPRNALSDATVLRSCYGLDDTNCDNLIYFEDVEYIDFGHNTTLTRIDYIAYMPKLKYIILSGSAITNLDVFAGHENLEFLEVVWCTRLKDISALETCTKLKYLNISHSDAQDVTVLYDLPLEMLSCIGAVTYNEYAALRQELPDCMITMKGNEYGEGWRYVNGVRSVHEQLRQEVFKEFLDGKE